MATKGLTYGVVGAGMAGAVISRRLADAGHAVQVLEKSGGTGGRLATRRTDYGAFDHGAQYVSARGSAFQALMDELQAAGAAVAWHPGGTDHARHTGLPGMSGLIKPLLDGVKITQRFAVEAIERRDGGVVVTGADGQSLSFDRVVVTAPSPQAHRLLVPVDPVFAPLADVVYAPCWTAMFAFEGAQAMLPDVHRGQPGDALGWFVREASRPGRDGAERFTVQAGPDWSRAHLELDKPVAAARLLDAMKARFPTMNAPVHAAGHRWRYSLVETALGTPFIADDDARLCVCGDGMLGGKVEAAHDSAVALADHLLATS